MSNVPDRIGTGGRVVRQCRGTKGRLPVAAVLMMLLLAGPAAARVTLISPSSESIASSGVMDMAEGMNGVMYFATDSGLSIFHNGWTTLRTSTVLTNGSILSDHVLAVETDHRGYLWVGYPNGLQVIRGPEIDTITDQQLLKNLNINALLRRADEMWVATGSAGVHRWREGTWYWFRPGGEEGLGAYDVRSMAEDQESGAIYLASADNGIWVAEPDPGPLMFLHLMAPVVGDPAGLMVRPDPFGGVYLFNRSTVLHHTFRRGFQTVVNAPDLQAGDISLYDLAVADDGTVWIATNSGIYGLTENRPTVHLTALEGIGSNAVKRIFTDHLGRVWFATPDTVGYLSDMQESGNPIPVHTVISGATVTPTATGTVSLPPPPPVISVEVIPGPAGSPLDPVTGFFSGMARWLAGLIGQKG